MNTSDSSGFSGEKIWDSIFDRVGYFAVSTSEQTGFDISIFLFFYLERKTAFAYRAAKDFYNFFFHGCIPYLVFP